MFCSGCGKELPDNTSFCPYCGASLSSRADDPSPIDAPEPEPLPQEEPSTGNASSTSADAGVAGKAGTVPPPVTPNATATQPAAVPPANDNIAIAALVCGIVGLFFSPSIIVGIALGIIAIMLASSYAKAGGTSIMARIGKVCGIIDLALSAILFILLMTVGCSVFSFIGSTTASQTTSSISVDDAADDDAAQDMNTSSGGLVSSDDRETVELSYDEEQDLNAQVSAYLDPIMAQENEGLDELAASVDDEFKEVFGFGLDETGVGARAYLLWRLQGMSWEISSVEAYSNGTAVVNVTLNSCYRRDVQSAFDYLMDVYIERGGDIHDPEKVGQVLEASQEMFYNNDVPDLSGVDTTAVAFKFVQAGDGSYLPLWNSWDYELSSTFAPFDADTMDLVLEDEELCFAYEMYPSEEYADPYLDGII